MKRAPIYSSDQNGQIQGARNREPAPKGAVERLGREVNPSN